VWERERLCDLTRNGACMKNHVDVALGSNPGMYLLDYDLALQKGGVMSSKFVRRHTNDYLDRCFPSDNVMRHLHRDFESEGGID
jgi:hypothetical protein